MTLAEAREALAAVLSTVEGVDVRARPIGSPVAGDGWVVVQWLVPADFTSCSVTLAAVVVLGADQARADEFLEELAVPLVDAVTSSSLCPADVSLEPRTVVAGQAATPLFVAVITLILEVARA
jgi:hypothetical protein